MPPDLLMRSTAISTPTSAVLPPAAAEPDSGCRVPILYGLAWPNAVRHGAGTSIIAPSAPAPAALHPTSRRRLTLPRYQNSSSRSCAFPLSVMAKSSLGAVSDTTRSRARATAWRGGDVDRRARRGRDVPNVHPRPAAAVRHNVRQAPVTTHTALAATAAGKGSPTTRWL